MINNTYYWVIIHSMEIKSKLKKSHRKLQYLYFVFLLVKRLCQFTELNLKLRAL